MRASCNVLARVASLSASRSNSSAPIGCAARPTRANAGEMALASRVGLFESQPRPDGNARGGFGPKFVTSSDGLLGHRAHRRRDPDAVTGFAVPVFLDGGDHLGGVTDNFDPHIGREGQRVRRRRWRRGRSPPSGRANRLHRRGRGFRAPTLRRARPRCRRIADRCPGSIRKTRILSAVSTATALGIAEQIGQVAGDFSPYLP